LAFMVMMPLPPVIPQLPGRRFVASPLLSRPPFPMLLKQENRYQINQAREARRRPAAAGPHPGGTPDWPHWPDWPHSLDWPHWPDWPHAPACRNTPLATLAALATFAGLATLAGLAPCPTWRSTPSAALAALATLAILTEKLAAPRPARTRKAFPKTAVRIRPATLARAARGAANTWAPAGPACAAGNPCPGTRPPNPLALRPGKRTPSE